MQRELIENIKQINDEISKASSLINKSRNDITLIAVSKKKSHELIKIAFQNGVNNFGENYAQELEERKTAEEVNRYLTKPEIEKKIREVRIDMEKAAKSLDFIEAAKFRDEIKILQDQL